MFQKFVKSSTFAKRSDPTSLFLDVGVSNLLMLSQRRLHLHKSEWNWRAANRVRNTPNKRSRRYSPRGISICLHCSMCKFVFSCVFLICDHGDQFNQCCNSTFNNGAGSAAPVFAQYLKDSKNPKYTVTQINTYPTTTYGVQVFTTLAYAWISDSVLNGARWPPIVLGGAVNIICYVSLAIWNIPTGWRWACYILSGAGYGLSGLCMT